MVYSTCTFNPLENEAVVAAVLQATKGALRLVDVSDEMPALRRNAGMATWQVRLCTSIRFTQKRLRFSANNNRTAMACYYGSLALAASGRSCSAHIARTCTPTTLRHALSRRAHRTCIFTLPPKLRPHAGSRYRQHRQRLQVQDPKSKKWYASWADAEPDVAEKGLKLDPTMFPPPADAASDLHLERVMRFLPHHQDTGGFFVAVLEKVADCSDLVVPTQSHRKRRQPTVWPGCFPPVLLPADVCAALLRARARAAEAGKPGRHLLWMSPIC